MSTGLAEAYGCTGKPSPEEREKLILEHLPQVRIIAMRIHERLPDSFVLDDLISTGILGLIAAIDHFEPAYNVKLKTYAEHKIRGAILDSIRDLDGIPTHRRQQARQISDAITRLEQKLQRTPSEQDVADELGISLEAYQNLLLDVRRVSIGSLDDGPSDRDDVSYGGLLADTEQELPLKKIQRSQLEELLTKGIAAMPPAERTVLQLYYIEEQTLREIAQVMDFHISRVAQLKTQAILRLRGLLATRWPTERGLY